jgi:hypothetical protein
VGGSVAADALQRVTTGDLLFHSFLKALPSVSGSSHVHHVFRAFGHFVSAIQQAGGGARLLAELYAEPAGESLHPPLGARVDAVLRVGSWRRLGVADRPAMTLLGDTNALDSAVSTNLRVPASYPPALHPLAVPAVGRAVCRQVMARDSLRYSALLGPSDGSASEALAFLRQIVRHAGIEVAATQLELALACIPGERRRALMNAVVGYAALCLESCGSDRPRRAAEAATQEFRVSDG